MCVYVSMCVCVYVCMCVHVRVRVCVHIYMYIYMFTVVCCSCTQEDIATKLREKENSFIARINKVHQVQTTDKA